MIVIDNYLSNESFEHLKKLVDHEIEFNDRVYDKKEHGEEYIDLGLENSGLYLIKDDAKTFFIQQLIDSRFLLPNTMEYKNESQLRYHECRFPYRSLWHKDRHGDWTASEIDYFGFNFYFNDDWRTEYGGLFIYKEAEKTSGCFVEPISNRLVINEKDDWHSVTQITNPAVTRKSLNYFVHIKYQNHDLHRI